MSEQEAFEIVAGICRSRGYSGQADFLDELARTHSPDPPQPPGVEVRIAVAIDDHGYVATLGLCHDLTEADAMDAVESNGDTHQAIVTAVIPPIAIPVVSGRVECATQQ